MASKLSSSLACSAAARPRLALASSSRHTHKATTTQQTRHATYIHRPRRPYTFTQIVQLSDGSTFTARTTSPVALHRCDRDSRNTLLWQPTEKSLQNVESDEAGKLAAFRQRFGRGFDMSAAAAAAGGAEGEDASAKPAAPRKGGARAQREAEARRAEEEAAAAAAAAEQSAYDLNDLISGYAAEAAPPAPEPKKAAPAPVVEDKKKKGKK